ncbi:MAG: AbrB/MazE/SpoVT family DNA-binding domain-containing protein [Coriobacteriales bacterium]|jgi:AbrB family looped-hinge helix DNA binding protein|nr:AbrB/MazE/SpoVT family DNA-binding domain-containing protein [Coriobacteriales bacterium]
MLTKLKEKSQVTIPKPVVKQLGLRTGDSLEVSTSDGVITLVPMELYPKPVMEKVKASVSAFDRGGQANEEVLQNIRELFGSMSGTSMSSEAFAASKQADLELE